MPSELRHILFRPAEVAQAVREYYRRTASPLPAGRVARCGPECEGPGSTVQFRMVFDPDPAEVAAAKSDDTRHEVIIAAPILAAALILYCRDRRIPMPATGDKLLQRFGEQVGLIVTINRKQRDLPSMEQLR